MLNFSPVATAMVIPGCNDGVLRGGNNGVTECKMNLRSTIMNLI